MTNIQKINHLRFAMETELYYKAPRVIAKCDKMQNNKSSAAVITNYSYETVYDLTMSKTVYDYNRNFKHIFIHVNAERKTTLIKFGPNTWMSDISINAVAEVLDYIDDFLNL